jgi:hypothetical protein
MKNFQIAKLILPFLFFFLFGNIALASSVSFNPPFGTFFVGETFDVSVLLDTKGKSINALQIFLTFPPDKLQVVSPSTGHSIVDVWTAPPKFNNTLGTISLEGGIPAGIIVSKGILTTVTFRVKSVGSPILKFLDKSRVFLNDGLATEDLGQMVNALYTLKLPPPQGPLVSSDTHPDQSVWYPSSQVILNFANKDPVGGYSYVLSDDPITIPDNISEGARNSVSYRNLADGIHYFHVKALRDGVWGGITHFALRVDITPPADFPVDILPGDNTTNTKPIIQFTTTDTNSGIDHYEIKLEPLSAGAVQAASEGEASHFFVESTSPYLAPPLVGGSYNVMVRAYDRATNYKEVTRHLVISGSGYVADTSETTATTTTKPLVITTPFFTIIGSQGILVKNLGLVTWPGVFIVGALLLILLIFIAYKVFHFHRKAHKLSTESLLPQDIAIKLQELRKYQEKYGVKMLIVLFVFLSLFSFHSVYAQVLEITPPLITNYSKDISEKEIFYVGGKTDVANGAVILYLQNLSTGETISENLASDKNGDWFYRHNSFLSTGEYLLWTQGKKGEVFSPPSPQEKMTVKQTAVSFGANRLSYEMIYLVSVIVLFLAILVLALFITFHFYHGRKKHQAFQKSIREKEAQIRRGFAMLGRDIASELAVVRKAKVSRALSAEEKEKEIRLLKDLGSVQKHIWTDIWQISQDSW